MTARRSTSRSTPLARELHKRLAAHQDPERAKAQQAYMKSAMPYFGVTSPEGRKIARKLFKEHRIDNATTWHEEVLCIWRNARHREERYAALELLGLNSYRNWLTPDSWGMLDELTVTGAWWDLVDALAPNQYGQLLAQHTKAIRPRILAYAEDNNIWRRRVSILCQLKFKVDTDELLLFRTIEASIGRPEFFIRKAIGWALRQYSRTAPDAVVDFVCQHEARLSPLSKREGLRLLGTPS